MRYIHPLHSALISLVEDMHAAAWIFIDWYALLNVDTLTELSYRSTVLTSCACKESIIYFSSLKLSCIVSLHGISLIKRRALCCMFSPFEMLLGMYLFNLNTLHWNQTLFSTRISWNWNSHIKSLRIAGHLTIGEDFCSVNETSCCKHEL